MTARQEQALTSGAIIVILFSMVLLYWDGPLPQPLSDDDSAGDDDSADR